MSKKMTFRKKSLAVILSLMMAMTALSGCGKEPVGDPEITEDEDALEVPEVKGKEETVGAITLLVPKGMEADEGISESQVILADEDDDETCLVISVVDKADAKDYVASILEDDDSYKEVSFSLDGVKWTGVAAKKEFAVYAKVGKKMVLVLGTGYKYTDDIPLAVLASLEVDDDAENVSGFGGASAGGTYTYGDGLFTVDYSEAYRLSDPGEFGTMVAVDGSQTVTIKSYSDIYDVYDVVDEIESYNYDEEEMTVGGFDAYLYTYENFYGEYVADFFIPFDYVYMNSYEEMICIHIRATADEESACDTADFRDLIKSVWVNPENVTDEEVGLGGGGTGSYTVPADAEEYWERGWYGWWIVYNADAPNDGAICVAWDCLATFDVDGDSVYMCLVDDGASYPTAEFNFNLLDDGSSTGWLSSESGYWYREFKGKEDRYGPFTIDSDCYMSIDPSWDEMTLHDYITFDVYVYDTDGNWLEVKGFLRPWGADWTEFESLPLDDLPEIAVGVSNKYANMYPFNYYDWYVYIMDDPFPGVYASSK